MFPFSVEVSNYLEDRIYDPERELITSTFGAGSDDWIHLSLSKVT
jgi:hypothetical protein